MTTPARPTTKREKGGFGSLTLGVILLSLILVLLVAAVGVVALQMVAAPGSGEDEAGEAAGTLAQLEAAAQAQERLEGLRREQLALAASTVARDPDVILALTDQVDPGSLELEAHLEELLEVHRLERIAVVEVDGTLLASAGAGSEERAVEMARRALEQGTVEGGWGGDGSPGASLRFAVAERVERSFDPLGAVVVVDLYGRPLALEARSASRAEVAYLSAGSGGARVEASTLEPEAEAQLPAELGPSLEGALAGSRSGPLTVDLGERRYRAEVAPLGAPDAPLGARVTLLPETEVATGPLRFAQLAVLGAAGLGLLLALLAAPLLGRRASRPLARVAEAAEAARGGDLARAARSPVPAALAAHFADAQERESLEAWAGSARRTAGAVGAGEEAGRQSAVVVAVEMSRYGRVMPDDEPRDVAARLGRDLDRVRRAVASQGGRFEAAAGHRALATFEGDRAPERALAAAARILTTLSKPENAFDEGLPPSVVVASGPAVLGGAESTRRVLGMPVQVAESLLREASPGDLLISKPLFKKLGETLEGAGLTIAPKNGLLSPQPLYALDARGAERVVGAAGSAPAAGLESLTPGALLAERFELLERRGADLAGATFLALDRQSDAVLTLRALRRELLTDPHALEGFDSELRSLLGVQHPAVARIYDLGLADGIPYLAYQEAPGVSLKEALPAAGAPAPAAGLRLARHLAAGLGAIHRSGLAHGGVHPGRLVVDPRGAARITDLGIPQLLPAPGVDPAADRALGAPRYLAPERLQGGAPSPAADLWAAGVVLAELFAGRLAGDSFETVEAWAGERDQVLAASGSGSSGPGLPGLDLGAVPERLRPLVQRCLARDPGGRYAHGGELVAALEGIRL